MLSPYRVLDLTDDRGELAGMVLADLGADVIRIEPPGGPLWPMKAISPPGNGLMSLTEEVQQTRLSAALMKPLVLGPQSRTPPALAAPSRRSCSARSPVSANPAA